MVCLEAAVPLHALEIRSLSEAAYDAELKRLSDIASLIGSQGDNLMFRGKKRGQAAEVFNALARGLALLAFAPGGVTFSGKHWEYRR